MSRNKSLATLSAALLLTLIAILVLVPGVWAQTNFKTLYAFTGGNDGGVPAAGLIFDAAGNLYGTTLLGGQLQACAQDIGQGCGVVFKLTPNANGGWSETVLNRFGNHPGAFPEANLIFDSAGNIYGATMGDQTTTFGSVFEITP
jgi:hypothetical protein